jgi:hypothetical protein
LVRAYRFARPTPIFQRNSPGFWQFDVRDNNWLSFSTREKRVVSHELLCVVKCRLKTTRRKENNCFFFFIIARNMNHYLLPTLSRIRLSKYVRGIKQRCSMICKQTYLPVNSMIAAMIFSVLVHIHWHISLRSEF